MIIRITNPKTDSIIGKVIRSFREKGWPGWTAAVEELREVKNELNESLRQIALLFPHILGKNPVETVKAGIAEKDALIAKLQKENADYKWQLDAKTRYVTMWRDKVIEISNLYIEKGKELDRANARTEEAIKLTKEAVDAGKELLSQRDSLRYNFGVVDRMNDDLLAQNCKLGADKILLQDKLKKQQAASIQLADTIIDLILEPAPVEVTVVMPVSFVPVITVIVFDSLTLLNRD